MVYLLTYFTVSAIMAVRLPAVNVCLPDVYSADGVRCLIAKADRSNAQRLHFMGEGTKICRHGVLALQNYRHMYKSGLLHGRSVRHICREVKVFHSQESQASTRDA